MSLGGDEQPKVSLEIKTLPPLATVANLAYSLCHTRNLPLHCHIDQMVCMQFEGGTIIVEVVWSCQFETTIVFQRMTGKGDAKPTIHRPSRSERRRIERQMKG